ncbi:MAG: pyridoxine 5'-phosphate oxidase C-terminal domain-containing protein [Puia sp.]
MDQYKSRFTENNIPRPPHWGGYLVRPVTIEFWQGRPNRLHDRLQYTLQENGSWLIERLAP